MKKRSTVVNNIRITVTVTEQWILIVIGTAFLIILLNVGSDPNDEFWPWLAKQVGDYSANDQKYIETFLENNTPLQAKRRTP